MELDSIFANTELLKTLATIAAAVVLLGITGLVGAYSTSRIVLDFKNAWVVLRGKVDAVIDFVDEADDPANKWIDDKLDSLVSANWDQYSAAFLPVFLRALADGMEKIAAPPQEVNLAPVDTNDFIDAQKYKVGP